MSTIGKLTLMWQIGHYASDSGTLP